MATNQEIKVRVYAIAERLLEGQTTQALQAFAVAEYGITERQARNYIRKARKQITQWFDPTFDYWISWHVQTKLTLYRQAVAEGQIRTANTISDSLAKIQGVIPQAGQLGTEPERLDPIQFKEKVSALAPVFLRTFLVNRPDLRITDDSGKDLTAEIIDETRGLPPE